MNAVTEQFVSVAAGQKQLQLNTQASALETQLEVASNNLAEAEARLAVNKALGQVADLVANRLGKLGAK